MAGLLSGLDKLGLGKLEGMDLFEEQTEQVTATPEKKPVKPQFNEEEVLFDKTYECPVCYGTIKERTLRTGKVKLLHTDMDLRPVYENMEPLKYDVITCPHCGYAVLSRYFQGLTSGQIKEVKEKISKSFKSSDEKKSTYTYEEAIERYKLCLVNTIVKHGKASEKAYICLKAGWLVRSMMENMDPDDADYDKKRQSAREQEKEFLRNALEGFIAARQSESYPMCGMDEITVEYLIAVLAMEFEKYDVAAKLITQIIVSPSANSRVKDKAREVKEILRVKMREKSI
ncbi:MAG: DUF2225 domain-containing protein [Lachnospiraceae bacterium]|nr:DUF2225 domain-containing protein [Lachnospiraceae bacterium]